MVGETEIKIESKLYFADKKLQWTWGADCGGLVAKVSYKINLIYDWTFSKEWSNQLIEPFKYPTEKERVPQTIIDFSDN